MAVKRILLIFATTSLLYAGCGFLKYSVNGTVRPIFVVGDFLNNRVLIWNSIVSLNRQSPDLVLGQPDMSSNGINVGAGAGAPTAQTLYRPFGIYHDGARLYIADQLNHRVLVWNSFPTQTFQAADLVLGQPDMISGLSNNGGTATVRSMSFPVGVYSNGQRLFVTDELNHRVLIWNSPPTSNFQPADLQLGQPDFITAVANSGGIGAQTLNIPLGICSDGTHLFVVDSTNSRILLWNNLPTVNRQPADLVIGEPDFVTVAGGTTSQKFSSAYACHTDGQRFFVADRNNSRILIWNSIPTTMNQPADVVLGQPNMNIGTANNGGLTAQGLNTTGGGVFSDGKRLFVADFLNQRVLVWNTMPTQNQQAADLVLGQPDMFSNTVNNGGLSAVTFQNPVGVYSNSAMSGLFRREGY